jgi:hypothetical protein
MQDYSCEIHIKTIRLSQEFHELRLSGQYLKEDSNVEDA